MTVLIFSCRICSGCFYSLPLAPRWLLAEQVFRRLLLFYRQDTPGGVCWWDESLLLYALWFLAIDRGTFGGIAMVGVSLRSTEEVHTEGVEE